MFVREAFFLIFALVCYNNAVLGAPQAAALVATAGTLPAEASKNAAVVPNQDARNASSSVVPSDTIATSNSAGGNFTVKDAADITTANNQTNTNTSVILASIKNETLPAPIAPPTNYTTTNSTDFPWRQTKRLAKDVIPIHYDLLLRPNIAAGNFTGTVSIIIKLLEPRAYIYLHMKALNVTMSELVQLEQGANNITRNATTIQIKDIIVFAKNEFLVLVLKDTALPGKYALNFMFNGTMLDKIDGFYRSSYKTKNNETRYLATTQFEATDARQAFPCFDEPSFKSTFNVSVMHPSGMTALSNMPVLATVELGSGVAVTRFERTPPMVTYLVAVIVSDFKYIETKSIKNGIPLRAYASPEQIDNGNLQYALDVLKYSINAYEEYFGIEYKLPKLDMVGIPDFQAGAMENWGLMTFREIYIVFDPNEAPIVSKHDVALTVAHEVAHQWFGDLVTTEWWDSLWLNEGFATRIEYVGVTDFDRDWPIPEAFVGSESQRALLADQLVSSHPIVVAGVTDPADIEELFDAIPYAKGASVLRMLEEFMGSENFRRGVSQFLRDKSFSTATSDDLWHALNEQLSQNCTAMVVMTNEIATQNMMQSKQCVDIKQVMDSWTLQMNYPIVNVEGLNATHGRLRQTRFLTDSTKANESSLYTSPYNYTWYIPVTFRALGSDSKHVVWTNTTEVIFDWPAEENTTSKLSGDSLIPYAVKFNPEQTGFYRENYPMSVWTSLADRLTNNISALPDARDRVGLLGDAFELARANILPYTVPLSFLNYLPQERSFFVWSTVSGALNFIGARLRAVPEAYGAYRELIRELIRPALDELGYADTGSSMQRRLRSLLLGLACSYGDVGCLRFTQQMYQDWIAGGKSISPNLRAVVYSYGMRYNNDEKSWQIMLEKLVASKSPTETRLLLSALSSSAQPWQLESFMELSFNNNFVRLHDQVSVFNHLTSNSVGMLYAWNFYRNNVPRLVARLTLNHRGLGQIPLQFAQNFNDQLHLDELKAVFKNYPEAGAGRLARRQAVETLESNMDWLRRNNETVANWLKQRKAPADAKSVEPQVLTA